MLQYLKYGEMPSPPEERRATNRWLQQLGRVGQRGFDFFAHICLCFRDFYYICSAFRRHSNFDVLCNESLDVLGV